MSSGVSSPSSHPPLPKKPSLAPKPQGVSLVSPSPKRPESRVPADTEAGTHDPAPLPLDAKEPPGDLSRNGSPGRPTPKPRKPVVVQSNGNAFVASAFPSPKPRLPPKRVASMQLSEQAQCNEAQTLPVSNGDRCEPKDAPDVLPTPRERPRVPARKPTIDAGDMIPEGSPGVSPRHSIVQQASSPVTDGDLEKAESNAESERLSPQSDHNPTLLDSDTGRNPLPSSSSSNVEEAADAGNDITDGGTLPSKPKPTISPKKPSLAMLSKSKTVELNSSFDSPKGSHEQGTKAVPQRPSFPPKIHSSNSASSAMKPKPQLKQVPVNDSSMNGNTPQELSNHNNPKDDSGVTDTSETDGISEKHSTLISGSPVEPPTKPVEAQLHKAPSILPRKLRWSPVAPPRRVKSMSESDHYVNFNPERLKNDHSTLSAPTSKEEQERRSQDLRSEHTNGKQSTFRRDRKALKSLDSSAFDTENNDWSVSKMNSAARSKPKPPRPPPLSRAPLPPRHVLPPRPKPVRAKTVDIPSPVIETTPAIPFAIEAHAVKTSEGESGSVKYSDDSPDCSDWVIVDAPGVEDGSTNPSTVSHNGPSVKSGVHDEKRHEITTEDKKESSKRQEEHNIPMSEENSQETSKVSDTPSETYPPRPVPAKKPEGDAVKQLKMRKAQPPVPTAAKPHSSNSNLSNKPASSPSSTGEKDVSSSDTPAGITRRPLSQGSPVSGRSPHGSPKKGRHSSPKRPSCPPPPPPPGGNGGLPPSPQHVPSPKHNASSPQHDASSPQHNASSPQHNASSPQHNASSPQHVATSPQHDASSPQHNASSPPTPNTPPITVKPKRPAPPRPSLPPVKPPKDVPGGLPKDTEAVASDENKDQINIYTEANSHDVAENEIDSDTNTAHDYELIPDRRRTLTRNSEHTTSSSEEATRSDSNRASGYIDDDGSYLIPDAKPEDSSVTDNDYMYPEFMPGEGKTIPASPSPPSPPPNPELDPSVLSPCATSSPTHHRQRRASMNHPKKKAPKKPNRSHSIQSTSGLSYQSQPSFDASTDGNEAGMEGGHRSTTSERSLSDDDYEYDDFDDDDDFTDEEGEDEDIDVHYTGVPDIHGDGGFDNLELPEARKRLQSLGRKAQKAFMVAKEIKDSEKVFVNVLKLLNVDLRQIIEEKSKSSGKTIIDKAALDQILGHLPHLQIFNECLLSDLESRIRNWTSNPKIADIFLTKGHFLKLYSQYILEFERITAAFDDACNKNPAFLQVVREFEASDRCANLAVKHYMLKPVQRIPQYKMLLTDYQKQLEQNSEELEKTRDALIIVSEVANHANESMRQGDNFGKLLAIQHSLIGSQEIVKPGRRFVKEGELQKLSRRVNQPRKFFLLSDILLHTTPLPTGQYKLNNELSLAGMKVSRSRQDDCNELSIISIQRSFTLLAASKEECESWFNALTQAISDYESKKTSFCVGRPDIQDGEGNTSSLGRKAPLWIPDSRVTMCMICTSEFTITWRRHHCRACGKVTCGSCSRNKAPLAYLSDKEARVCDDCYDTLVLSQIAEDPIEEHEGKEKTKGKSTKTKRRKSGRLPSRPSALKVSAKDKTNSSMSGYLWTRNPRKKDWKKMWYRISDKVLYKYKASEDVVALESMPLLGYVICVIHEQYEGYESGLTLQLTQGPMKVILRADSTEACDRWNKALIDASCLD